MRQIKNIRVLQQIFVYAYSNPVRRFDFGAFARKFGVPRPILLKWAKDPTVRSKIKEVAREMLGGAEVIAQVYRSLAQAAILGSFKHQRLLLELAGEYTPGVDLKLRVPIEAKFNELERKSANELRLLTAGSRSAFPKTLPLPKVLLEAPTEDQN